MLGVFLSDLCELKLVNIMLRLLIVFRLSANTYEIVSQHMSGWVVKTTCCIIDYMFEFVASGLSQHVFSSKVTHIHAAHYVITFTVYQNIFFEIVVVTKVSPLAET